MTEHLDQTVDAKSIDLSSYQIAYSGLRDFEQLCRGCLGEVLFFDHPRNLDHQIGTHFHVQCLFGLKPEISENVSTRFLNHCCHSDLLVRAPDLPEVFEAFAYRGKVRSTGLLTLLVEGVEDVDCLGVLGDRQPYARALLGAESP